jgi:hypothetical protein
MRQLHYKKRWKANYHGRSEDRDGGREVVFDQRGDTESSGETEDGDNRHPCSLPVRCGHLRFLYSRGWLAPNLITLNRRLCRRRHEQFCQGLWFSTRYLRRGHVVAVGIPGRQHHPYQSERHHADKSDAVTELHRRREWKEDCQSEQASRHHDSQRLSLKISLQRTTPPSPGKANRADENRNFRARTKGADPALREQATSGRTVGAGPRPETFGVKSSQRPGRDGPCHSRAISSRERQQTSANDDYQKEP